VILRTADGRPIPGRVVRVRASGLDTEFVPSDAVPTGLDGTAEIRITSTRAERKQLSFTVSNAGIDVELPVQPEVDFVPASVARRRVSVSSAGTEANDESGQPAVSGNGRFVAFQSKADNLVAGDDNGKEDVFVHDRDSGVVELVSLQPDGTPFPDLCGVPSLTDDGRLVAFEGRATDTDAVYVRDRLTGSTTRLPSPAGGSSRCFDARIAGDGNSVAFLCNNGEWQRVFVRNLLTGTTTLVSVSSTGAAANGACERPSISRDGRFVAFASIADNLVSGDSNDKYDVFVHDLATGATRRVSVASNGDQGDDDSIEAAIAADGGSVGFASKAQNLVAGDDNGKSDVFVHDLLTAQTVRVSLDPQGNEVDKESDQPALSADGRFVVFASQSDDLVAGDRNGKQDVFRRDLVAGVTVRVSLARGGGDPNEDTLEPALAADAPVVAFTGKADNLVANDDNDKEDVFVAPRD
jgi:Tol biopolymer transport system component